MKKKKQKKTNLQTKQSRWWNHESVQASFVKNCYTQNKKKRIVHHN